MRTPTDTRPDRPDRGAPSAAARVLRVAGFSLLALWLLRSLAAVAPPPGGGGAGAPPVPAPAALPDAPPVPGADGPQPEGFDELVARGAELVRLMRAGVVASFDERGIGVHARFLELDAEARSAVCRALRTRADEVRPVFSAATGAALGRCDASARFATAARD